MGNNRTRPTTRVSAITDWRTRDEDLPDLAPGDEIERRITPQKFVALHHITTVGVRLVSLRIGAAEKIPFTLAREDDPQRTYALADLSDPDVEKRIAAVGAAILPDASIAIPPAMDVVVVLRNEGTVPVKPRVALLVQEEI